MKVILDTNVVASGIFFPSGPPRKILEALYEDQFSIIVSMDIISEYVETVNDLLHNYPNKLARRSLDLIVSKSELCQAEPLRKAVCKDPKDDMVIACAISGGVKVIVSGDKHLLDISGYQGVTVLKPRQFLDKYLSN